MFSVQIEGGKLLERKLLALERKVAKKIVRSAVRKGAKVVLRATKANAKSMVGGSVGSLISKNTAVRVFKKQRRGQFGVGIKQRPGIPQFEHITKSGVRYYIPSAIEYGHALPGAGGSKQKDIAAIPFMRSAFDSTREAAKQVVINTMRAGIELAGK